MSFTSHLLDRQRYCTILALGMFERALAFDQAVSSVRITAVPAALLALFLAACVRWLIWRAFRRLLSLRKRTLEPNGA